MLWVEGKRAGAPAVEALLPHEPTRQSFGCSPSPCACSEAPWRDCQAGAGAGGTMVPCCGWRACVRGRPRLRHCCGTWQKTSLPCAPPSRSPCAPMQAVRPAALRLSAMLLWDACVSVAKLVLSTPRKVRRIHLHRPRAGAGHPACPCRRCPAALCLQPSAGGCSKPLHEACTLVASLAGAFPSRPS